MAKRVTMADVARAAGFSTATVSLALSATNSRIPEETVRAIKAAADSLGYVRNASAQSLRTGKTQTIGFVSDEVIVTRFASAMVRGILDAAEERDHAVTMMESGHDEQRFRKAFGTLTGRGVDAYIVGLMASREVAIPELPEGKPIVMINSVADGQPAILPDEFAAGREAVDVLYKAGHRHIALIGRHEHRPTPLESVNIGVRMDGIDAAMEEFGLAFVDEYLGADWEPDLGYEGAKAILARTPHTTAIIAANDRIAFGVYRACREDGYRIPDDVSVLSFDDEELAQLLHPGLTTMRLPYREMGETAVALVLGEGEIPARTLLPLELVERESVSAPRARR